MSKETNNSMSPEEMAKASQDAIKAAMEQAQALYGNIPGFQSFDLAKMQEKLIADAAANIPGMEGKVQQPEMEDTSAMSPEEVMKMYSQGLDFVGHAMVQCDPDMMSDDMKDMLAGMDDMFDFEWEIERKDDGKLTPTQQRLLAFGAPLLVLSSDYVDSIETSHEMYNLKEMLKDSWDVTDRTSALETIGWLLHEGHHEKVDKVLAEVVAKGLDNLSEEELQDEETKTAEVCTTIEKMLEDGYCSAEDLPATALAWDLVRAVNMARWTHLFGYISEEEMWQTMQAVAESAGEHFVSWNAYGLSFVLGRGAWQGDSDQCEGAYEIVSTLLEKAESPWMQFEFNPSNG